MDAIPVVMRTVIGEFHAQRSLELTVPQFRVLAYLHRHKGSSLSDVAQHFSLSLPTMSKVVEGLVRRAFVIRDACTQDRRRVVLNLSESGLSAFDAARTRVESRMAQRLSTLSPQEKQTVSDAMDALRSLFDPAAFSNGPK